MARSTKPWRSVLAIGLLASMLAGCGGSDGTAVGADTDAGGDAGTGGDTGSDGGTGGAPPAFVAKAVSVPLPQAGSATCIDFDTASASADCAAADWDLKLVGSGRSAQIFTNSGPSGPGQGGAFGSPLDWTWAELQAYTSALVSPDGQAISPRQYVSDSAKGAFSGDSNSAVGAAFEYGLDDTFLLYPTYRVFLVTTDSGSADAVGTAQSPVFAVQIIGYYGGPSGTASGYVTFRWADRTAPTVVRTATLDASGSDEPVYFDLVSGTETSATGNWQIAFQRFNVLLNGGSSGSGSVAGFLARTPDGLYDADGEPVVDAFLAATPDAMLGELTAAPLATPASARNWVSDEIGSVLSPGYEGTYPAPLNFGFYTYFPTADAASGAGLPAVAHLLAANPDRGAWIRSGDGAGFARVRLADIRYADSSDSSSDQTWTFEAEVQSVAP